MPVITSRLTPGLPEGFHRPLAALLLLLVAGALAWLAHAAGWPREQVLATAVLIATVLLWVTETLPLFATAFTSISLQILLLANPGEWFWLGFEDNTGPTVQDFMSAAVDPVLLLFFSGLVLSRAAVKTGVDRRLASLVLRPAMGSPAALLAGVMASTSFFSLWMSNTATTALMLTLLVPVLSQLAAGTAFRRALVIAVPLSANIAGMSTPIASPPNAIAMSYINRAGLELSFLTWMLVAIPLVVALLVATWWWLLRSYPPPSEEWSIELPPASLSRQGAWVVTVAVLTFATWITEPVHGIPAPVAAALPVTLFFATNVITREDVNTLDWDVLILIAGGLALGYTLQVTELDQRLAAVVPLAAADWLRLGAVAVATVTLGTFFSNTAVASMFIPVAVIAATASSADVRIFVLVTAFVASLSMALPVSTPPNAMAYGSGELTSRDFVRTGGIVSLVGVALVVLLAVAWRLATS